MICQARSDERAFFLGKETEKLFYSKHWHNVNLLLNLIQDLNRWGNLLLCCLQKADFARSYTSYHINPTVSEK
jgi:hypothetical protein